MSSLAADPGFAAGLNVAAGEVANEAVAAELGLDPVPGERALAALAS